MTTCTSGQFYLKKLALAPDGKAKKRGRGSFLIRQALALLDDFNTATHVAKVTVPRGTVVWEGLAAPQTSEVTGQFLSGGGRQTFISWEELLTVSFETLGTLPP